MHLPHERSTFIILLAENKNNSFIYNKHYIEIYNNTTIIKIKNNIIELNNNIIQQHNNKGGKLIK